MTKEEVEQVFEGVSPYYAYKQGLQEGAANNEEYFDIACARIKKAEVDKSERLF